MRISEGIKKLEIIKEKFGDIKFAGGYLHDDSGLRGICVVDVEGMEVFPHDPNGVKGQNEIDGVFLE